MANYLKMPQKAQVLALLELGWSYRRIEAETVAAGETDVPVLSLQRIWQDLVDE